jgi:acetyltransferase-like isoleucine patch superfamily enzyme
MAWAQVRKSTLVTALELVCWLMPPFALKNRLLARFGHDVASTARIGPTIAVDVMKFSIGEHVRIGLFNVFRGMSEVRMEDYAIVDSWNWISAHPSFQQLDPKAGTLFLGVRARIGSRCYVDCSGTVIIRAFAEVGGHRCLLQTHEIDYERKVQTAGRITVGHHSFVGSCAVMLKDSVLPDQSLLAANATMTRGSAVEEKRGLYAGSPAKWKRETTGDFFDDVTYWTVDNVVDGAMGVSDEDVDESYKFRIIDPPE